MTESLKETILKHADGYANARERDGKMGHIALTATGYEYSAAVRVGYEAVRKANEHRAMLEGILDTMIQLTSQAHSDSNIVDVMVECISTSQIDILQTVDANAAIGA